uniref:Secreted protein n=1 Tax=Oryza nivara TaxID=4536 RepID=A0A0E0I8Q6_ORYNI
MCHSLVLSLLAIVSVLPLCKTATQRCGSRRESHGWSKARQQTGDRGRWAGSEATTSSPPTRIPSSPLLPSCVDPPLLRGSSTSDWILSSLWPLAAAAAFPTVSGHGGSLHYFRWVDPAVAVAAAEVGGGGVGDGRRLSYAFGGCGGVGWIRRQWRWPRAIRRQSAVVASATAAGGSSGDGGCRGRIRSPFFSPEFVSFSWNWTLGSSS